MTLRKEYQAIVDDYEHDYGNLSKEHITAGMVASHCQALADKPPKMLNLEEIERIFKDTTGSTPGRQSTAYAVAIEAAHIAKQKEPETRKVKIGVYRRPNGQIVTATDDECVYADCVLIDSFEREITI